MKDARRKALYDTISGLPKDVNGLYRICRERCERQNPWDIRRFDPIREWATEECEKCRYRLRVDKVW